MPRDNLTSGENIQEESDIFILYYLQFSRRLNAMESYRPINTYTAYKT